MLFLSFKEYLGRFDDSMNFIIIIIILVVL